MRRVTALLIATVAVLLSGCFRLDVEVDVHDDGSGTVREVIAVDPRLANAPTAIGDQPGIEVTAADLLGPLPSWAEVRPYRERGLEGVTVEVAFADPGQLAERLRRVNRAVTDAAGRNPGSPAAGGLVALRNEVVLEPVEGGWRFRATPRHLGLAADLTPLGQPVDPRRLEAAKVELAVRLPGHVVAHNGDAIDGNLVTWTIPLSPTAVGADRTELVAESRPGPAPDAAPVGRRPASGPLMTAAVVVATVGGAVVLLVSSRRRPVAAAR